VSVRVIVFECDMNGIALIDRDDVRIEPVLPRISCILPIQQNNSSSRRLVDDRKRTNLLLQLTDLALKRVHLIT